MSAVYAIDSVVLSGVVWFVIGAAVLIFELVALFGDEELPTIGDVLSHVMRSTAGRWFMLVGWVWLGWHLFVR